MAVDLTNPDSRARLGRAIRRSFDLSAPDRARRADLIDIFRDRTSLSDLFTRDTQKLTYLNLFSQFVRGQEITLAYSAPTWSINARTVEGKGFDKRIQAFLAEYACILNFQNLVHQWAVDTAFGRAVAKVITSIAPKGISSPVAPRVFRLNPDNFIVDRSASSLEEATYLGDVYFTDLDEAKTHPFFDREGRSRLTEWTGGSGGSNAWQRDGGDDDLFASAQTRLVDMYIPTLGVVATWEAPNDNFDNIAQLKPLQAYPAPNPYIGCDLMSAPDSLETLSRLGQLRPLNMFANDMFSKMATQARQSQRNPVAMLGDDMDANSVLKQPDGEMALLSNPKSLDIFTIPGPDSSIVQMVNMASGEFSRGAGNLNVSLGQSPGASTARQTQALIGQINESQAVDRSKFETFLGEVGKRLATLAFHDEALQLSMSQQIPGTKYFINNGWGPPQALPRIGTIDDYKFEIVTSSTSFRGPQERFQQLMAASQMVLQMMQAQAMGAPIDIEAVLADAAESFDLVPRLMDWWNGQPPTPQEKSSNTYQSMAGASQGSDVRYQGVGDSGGGVEDFGAPALSGLASGGV